jgi:hypothetical protein
MVVFWHLEMTIGTVVKSTIRWPLLEGWHRREAETAALAKEAVDQDGEAVD